MFILWYFLIIILYNFIKRISRDVKASIQLLVILLILSIDCEPSFNVVVEVIGDN